MFNGVPYLVGYLILSYAHYASTATVFKALLLTGRFISGLGLGWSCAVCPVSPILHVVSLYVCVDSVVIGSLSCGCKRPHLPFSVTLAHVCIIG